MIYTPNVLQQHWNAGVGLPIIAIFGETICLSKYITMVNGFVSLYRPVIQ